MQEHHVKLDCADKCQRIILKRYALLTCAAVDWGWLIWLCLSRVVQHNFADGANTKDEAGTAQFVLCWCCWRATIVAVIDMDALIDMRPPG